MAPKGKKKVAKTAPPPTKAPPPPSAAPAKASDTAPKSAKSVKNPLYKPGSIGEKRQLEYEASRPALTICEDPDRGYAALNTKERERAPLEFLREGATYRNLSKAEQTKFLKHCETLGVVRPLEKPRPLGKDHLSRRLEDYLVEEYEAFEARERRLRSLRILSAHFDLRIRKRKERLEAREKGVPDRAARICEAIDSRCKDDTKLAEILKRRYMKNDVIEIITEQDFEEERERRIEMAQLRHEKVPGRYALDPKWDDVEPLEQEEGETALAKIAYSYEYSEAISYLRALMAAKEYSPRALELTAHIIDLNPAHYTVWLYRSTVLLKLNSDLNSELEWVNETALDNQKNYQIWHHRQLIISTLYENLYSSRTAILDLASSEINFMHMMFDRDSKNYHVWSYRQWLVRRLEIFPSQVQHQIEIGAPDEIAGVEALLKRDVRNNSAWSHRFFIVFSDPGHSTLESKATERDEKIPDEIINREIEFAKTAIRLAPQSQCGWNYLRGVSRKGGRSVVGLEDFGGEFVKIDGANDEVKSSHALDFLADVWAEKGEKEKATTALKLLAGKYDQVRKKYWEWRLEMM